MRDVWKEMEVIKENGGQPDAAIQHLYGQKKKTARRAVDKAKRERWNWSYIESSMTIAERK